MPKVLDLTFALGDDGTRQFKVGLNCDDIKLVNGCYVITQGTKRTSVHASSGVLREDTKEDELPPFGLIEGDAIKCRKCKKVCDSVHALKVHHGMVHAVT
jgi:hypothetical protein